MSNSIINTLSLPLCDYALQQQNMFISNKYFEVYYGFKQEVCNYLLILLTYKPVNQTKTKNNQLIDYCIYQQSTCCLCKYSFITSSKMIAAPESQIETAYFGNYDTQPQVTPSNAPSKVSQSGKHNMKLLMKFKSMMTKK